MVFNGNNMRKNILPVSGFEPSTFRLMSSGLRDLNSPQLVVRTLGDLWAFATTASGHWQHHPEQWQLIVLGCSCFTYSHALPRLLHCEHSKLKFYPSFSYFVTDLCGSGVVFLGGVFNQTLSISRTFPTKGLLGTSVDKNQVKAHDVSCHVLPLTPPRHLTCDHSSKPVRAGMEG